MRGGRLELDLLGEDLPSSKPIYITPCILAISIPMDNKRKFLSLVSYNHAITHGVVLSIPIAANYIQHQLDLSYTQVFIPLSISIFMYGIGAVLAG